MTTHRLDERGFALMATAITLFALLAITGIAVEVARLTTTATEVQIAADAAALSAALVVAKDQTLPTPICSLSTLQTDGQSRGQTVAATNFADGRSVDTTGVDIEVGYYNPDPAADPHFSPPCTPCVNCNAAKAKVTVQNVNYITARLMPGVSDSSTSIEKTAVAAARCQGSAIPFPLAVCSSALSSIDPGALCSATPPPPVTLKPDDGVNGCWTCLQPGNTGSSCVQDLFPAQCGGTNQINNTIGDPIGLTNGTACTTWAALQCCVACQNIHDFTVPVIACADPNGGGCAGNPTVLGFTTITIANATDIITGCGRNKCKDCSADIDNPGSRQMSASQVCKNDLSGSPAPFGANCYGNTTVPLMGQLP